MEPDPGHREGGEYDGAETLPTSRVDVEELVPADMLEASDDDELGNHTHMCSDAVSNRNRLCTLEPCNWNNGLVPQLETP